MAKAKHIFSYSITLHGTVTVEADTEWEARLLTRDFSDDDLAGMGATGDESDRVFHLDETLDDDEDVVEND